MKKSLMPMTTAQFARFHGVNKRTLHYYDEIGLFCPAEKGENGYRYYDISQSMDFEYIRMLKELNMSIQEISAYQSHPNEDAFLKIAEEKEKEITCQIQKLQAIKQDLERKRKQILFCKGIEKQKIQVEEMEEEQLLVIPEDLDEYDVLKKFAHIKEVWTMEQIRGGVGDYISIESIEKKEFDRFEGLYTRASGDRKTSDFLIKPKGKYLCGYQKGTWDELPDLYEAMMDFAKKHHWKLTGYAFEMGLNEFAIGDPFDYVTQVQIQIQEES